MTITSAARNWLTRRFGDGVLAALGFGRLGLHAGLDAERVGVEVVGGVHGQVEVVDGGAGVRLAPFGDDFGRQLARDGIGAQDAGIDVQQFHDLSLSFDE